MIEVEEAQERILSLIPSLPSEAVALHEAAGRTLAAAIFAPTDLPPFDNSAMDGYAVQAEDLTGASQTNPVTLRQIGRVAAGDAFNGCVVRGSCVRLFTGSPLPNGADAVVMQEDTRRDADEGDGVAFLDAVKPWENVRLKGEDTKRGTALLAAGERLTSSRISLLAATGLSEVSVSRQPVIGLIATGSELIEPGQPLGSSQIYESNRIGLAGLVSQAGGRARILPIAKDTIEETRAILERAFEECDAVVSTGGVSVGEFDFVKAAFESLGGELAFWQVAMRPGKPFVFGTWRGKFLFGLPGNPVSAFVTFLILARPALLRFQGAAEVRLSAHLGKLAEPLVNRGDRRHYVRVKAERDGAIRRSGVQASHVLSSLACADGLVDMPPHTEWQAGMIVPVLRWE